MVLSYYNKFDDFAQLNIDTINPCLCCLLLTPLLFIDKNYGPLLVVSVISFVQLFKQYKLKYINQIQKNKEIIKQEEEEEDEDEEEEEEDEDEDEEDEEEDEEEEDEEEEDEEEDEEEEKKEEEEDNDCKDSDCKRNCHLTILTDIENKKQYIINKFISTSTSKITQLGSINLVDLILLEIKMLEQDIEQLKQDNEIYEYATFDKKLYELTNVNLECAWRRYKHILNENEYKDNTYTIL
jgi:chemotaxis protein histidine kinase CheA